MAKAGLALSHKLRDLGLYQLVDFSKRVGLKKLIFGSAGNNTTTPSPDEERFLRELLCNEMNYI